MQIIKKHRWFMLTIALVLVAVALVVFFLGKPHIEQSKQPAPKNVFVQAQIETDGSMSVIDQRTFQLSENEPLSWEIAKTTSMSSTTVSGVRVISEDNDEVRIVPFEEVTSHEISGETDVNKWAFDKVDNLFNLALSPELLGKTIVVEVSYVQHNAVFVYDDVAELYWDYLPSSDTFGAKWFQKNTDSNPQINISAQVLIPSTSNVGFFNRKTVWGWGHGFPGTVEFSEGGAYTFESVTRNLEKTSSAHIIFPSNCLVNFDKNSTTNLGGARKNSAIAEETKWSDEWSVQQSNSCILNVWECVIAGFVVLLTLLKYAFIYSKYKHILSNNVSLNEQLVFDERCARFQKHTLILSFVMLLVSILCAILLESVVGSIAFFLCFVVCLLQCNWTPSVHSSFRDRIIL